MQCHLKLVSVAARNATRAPSLRVVGCVAPRKPVAVGVATVVLRRGDRVVRKYVGVAMTVHVRHLQVPPLARDSGLGGRLPPVIHRPSVCCAIRVTIASPSTGVWTEREREMFYLMMHSTHFIYGYMASDHSDSEKGNPLPPHRLLLSIISKGSFICTIPQTR